MKFVGGGRAMSSFLSFAGSASVGSVATAETQEVLVRFTYFLTLSSKCIRYMKCMIHEEREEALGTA
jgi:hypothetical protein